MNDLAAANLDPTDGNDIDQPALIVFGRDDKDKPHASWFAAGDAELAVKASTLMGMVALAIDNDDLRGIAAKLPQGKVFASGRGFVPFVKAAVFDQLVTHLPDGKLPAMKPVPKPDSPKPSKARGRSKALVTPHLPQDWGSIVKGSLVLAAEPDEPWCEAVVVETKGDNLLVLRWRDYQDWPNIVRRREDVALLHPMQEGSGA